jgi:hypothetical protein
MIWKNKHPETKISSSSFFKGLSARKVEKKKNEPFSFFNFFLNVSQSFQKVVIFS